MSQELNKRIVRVVLDDLFRETSYQYFAEVSGFEGHMVDYDVSPIRIESAEQEIARKTSMVSEMRRSGKALSAVYPDGNTRAIRSLTAEGDRVVAEYFTYGGRTIFRDDEDHKFHCVKIFELRDSKIVRMREYCDSAYLTDFGSDISRYMHETPAGGVDQNALDHSSWGTSWLLRSDKMELGPEDGTVDGSAELDENRRIARVVVERWGSRESADHLHDDVLFSNEVDLRNTPALGRAVHGKNALATVHERVAELFPGGVEHRITAVTAEENRVAVEEIISGMSPLRPDKPFRVPALKILFFRDGKVFRVRQHLDSGFIQAYAPEAVEYVFGTTDAVPAFAQ
ncbi:nuclear transport factor 2 family protein [Cryptosporangium sp. NPDC051539]|uniref:nuclear transport factor 2 family protein n=1 Tax=Cryptosporangium sp. NPDC051539 TaxID=3363962 RepID=UPI0037B2B8B6